MTYPPTQSRSRRRDRAIAGWSALAAVLLFLAGNALWVFDQPGFGASGPQLVRFYRDASGRIVAGALVSLVSFACLLVFAGALRAVLVDSEEGELDANVAFAAVLVTVAAGFGAEGINMAAALSAADGRLGQTLAQALFDTSYVFGYNAAGIGLGTLALALAAAALRRGALLPRWLAVLAAALGALLLTPLSRDLLGGGFGLVGIVGIQCIRRPRGSTLAAGGR